MKANLFLLQTCPFANTKCHIWLWVPKCAQTGRLNFPHSLAILLSASNQYYHVIGCVFRCSLSFVFLVFPTASPPTATRKLLHLAWTPLSKQITSHSEYTGICLQFCIQEALKRCQIWSCLEYSASRTRRDLQATIPEWSNIDKQPNANVRISVPWQYSCNHRRIAQGRVLGK